MQNAANWRRFPTPTFKKRKSAIKDRASAPPTISLLLPKSPKWTLGDKAKMKAGEFKVQALEVPLALLRLSFRRKSKPSNRLSTLNQTKLLLHLPKVLQIKFSPSRIKRILKIRIKVKSTKRKNMFPPGLEPGTFRVLGERDNHYTTETWRVNINVSFYRRRSQPTSRDRRKRHNFSIETSSKTAAKRAAFPTSLSNSRNTTHSGTGWHNFRRKMGKILNKKWIFPLSNFILIAIPEKAKRAAKDWPTIQAKIQMAHGKGPQSATKAHRSAAEDAESRHLQSSAASRVAQRAIRRKHDEKDSARRAAEWFRRTKLHQRANPAKLEEDPTRYPWRATRYRKL